MKGFLNCTGKVPGEMAGRWGVLLPIWLHLLTHTGLLRTGGSCTLKTIKSIICILPHTQKLTQTRWE